MRPRGIDLIFLEQDKIVRRNFAEVLPQSISKGRYTFQKTHFLGEEAIETGEGNFRFKDLAVDCIRAQHKVHKLLFRKIINGNDALEKNFPYPVDSYQHLAAVPLAYATTEAFTQIRYTYQKETETDAEINAVAHYDEKEGIVVSLYQKELLEKSITHEYGHYLHHTLNKEKYWASTPTMKEVMAIFVENKCGSRINYWPNLPHHRAQQLLETLHKIKRYREAGTKGQWEFLIQFTGHQELASYIENYLSRP